MQALAKRRKWFSLAAVNIGNFVPPLDTGIMSLIIPTNSQECIRATFCEHSLFFSSERAASRYLDSHPEAMLLSIEDAATVGKRVAASRFVRKNDLA